MRLTGCLAALGLLFVQIPAWSDTTLLDALRGEDPAAAARLLDAGANVQEKSADGTTALHWAAHFGYVDLAQRLLKAVLAGSPVPYDIVGLEAMARHCTEAEDAAKKVERQVMKSAAAILLASRLGEAFDALVTGASDAGTWVRVLDPPIEGRLISGFAGLRVGTRIRIRLDHTDVRRGFIDFGRLA